MQEVLVELNRQNQAKQDFISPAQGMHLREDGHTFEINHLTTSQQEVFGTTSLFHRQVASALGIPAKYYDLMQTQKPELLAENVNSWFADKPSSYMVRSMDYGAGQVARALLSERYRRIDNMEIATAVLPLFAGNDQYGINAEEQEGILKYLIEGGDLSLYGLSNAVTRASQDVVSYDRATTLEGIGWQVATMEPQQWKQINQ